MPTHPILIAGGGIAGIASALGLMRSGRESRVFEKAGGFETVGAGLQIGPNAVRALKYLGSGRVSSFRAAGHSHSRRP
jgi:salicylate hydroxylase